MLKKLLGRIRISLILCFAMIGLAFGIFIGESRVQAAEDPVISSMSVYKDVDYSFLKEFDFGGNTGYTPLLTYDTAEKLAGSTDIRLKEGRYIRTLGYYEKGDFGGATYLISSKAEEGCVELANGLYANILPDIYVDSDGTKWVFFSVKQFGAKGDGVNADNVGINKAICAAGSYAATDEYDRGFVYIPAGEYRAADQVHLNTQNINLVGDGDDSVIFTDNDYRKDTDYYEHFFMSWYGENLFLGNFRVEARECDWTRYMRQMSLFYCNNVYLYQVDYYIPQEAWSGAFYEDKQYTNLTIYTGDKNITVDDCTMYQMSGTYRGANIGIMDFWSAGTENITIMNCELHDNARDEQIGIFSRMNIAESYIKNVDLINNDIYTYTTPYKNIHGGRTMCFTISYDYTQVDDIYIANNHFISEADSKFMTFGSVTNCVIENNIIEIYATYGSGSYIFDSSNPADENVLINNNEFYITYKNSPNYGKYLSAGHLTFSNNTVFMDCTVGKLSDWGGNYDNNNFIAVTPLTSCGSAPYFTNNTVYAYGGHSGYYNEILFQLSASGTENVYSGNAIYDYTYFYGSKGSLKPFDRLSSLGAALDSFIFTNNIYRCPNYSYKSESDYFFITWYRDADVKSFVCEGNDFQGAKEMFGYEVDLSANTCREFTSDPSIERVSSVDITQNGEVVTEIYTTQKTVTLDKIVRILDESSSEEKEVTDREILWLSSINSLAGVKDGVVTRKQYGTVSVYATTTDGSGKFAKVVIHFIEAQAKEIQLEQESLKLEPGEIHDVMYQVLPVEKADQTLIWTSSDETVATVSKDGIITAVGEGTAKITCATGDGSKLSKTISVTVAPLSVKKIQLEESWKYFEEQTGTYQIKVQSFVPENATNAKVGRWESSNEAVATVDQNGLVTVKGGGVCYIYAYSTDESCYATCTIYVKPDKVEITKTKVGKTYVGLTWDQVDNVYGYNIYRYDSENDSWDLLQKITPETTTSYTFYSLASDTDYQYYITAFVSRWDSYGNRYLYEGEPSEICTVHTFEKDVITILVSGKDHISITVGEKGKTYISYYPGNAECESFDLEIADESIAEIVNKDAKSTIEVKGLKEGFTTLTISSKDANHCSITIPIGVMPSYQVTEVEAEDDYRDAVIRWKAIKEEDKIDGYVVLGTKTSEFYEIASIPLEELRTSTYSDGSTCYTYTHIGLDFSTEYRYKIVPYIEKDGQIYTCLASSAVKVQVQDYIAVESINAEEEYVIKLGETKEITASSGNADASHQEFIWISKDESIAAVTEAGATSATIKGISAGITRLEIIANDEDCTFVAPKIVVLPQKVTNLKGTALPKSIRLTWNKVSGATGYNIYRYNSKKSSWELLGTTMNCSYTDTSVDIYEKYRYKVCAYVADASKSYEGTASSEIKVQTTQLADSSFTGLCKWKDAWYYVKNGVADLTYTGLCKRGTSWFYVKGGVVNFNYTGLCKRGTAWFYVKNGVVNFNYTGLCKHGTAWYYVKSGVVNFNYTGLCKHGNAWFYVKSGVVNFNYTGLCKHGNAWYYVKNGVVNFKYTGLCKHGNAWYYVKNGVVNFKYTGLCKHGNAWFYVKNGVVNFKYTGLCKHGTAWFYVKNGVVNFKYTGYVKHAGANWYVKAGVMQRRA
ncbi:MAG: Ig-like domain-containing protein [Agathobacter sp.]|nr:Ig-like domain-containing protein [Agathobacter sp.]